MKSCVIILLLLMWACIISGTFILNFQSTNELSTEEWAEYTGKIPPMDEFTSCLWEKLRRFATDYTAVWGYCKQKSQNDQSIKCTQFYHRGTPLTLNRHINVYGWLDGKTEVTAKIKKYMHQTWNHFCWKYSRFSGNNKFYYNGELVGTVQMEERPVIGSDDALPDALIIGQEQDAVKGRYELSQMFNGEISELNIWNSSLDEQTILNIATCKDFRRGNIVSWEKDEFVINNALVTGEVDPTLFCKHEPQYVFFPQVETLDNAKTLCTVHGGRIATPHDIKENTALMTILNDHGSHCLNMQSARQKGRAIWLGFQRLDDKWFIVDDDTPVEEAVYGNWDPFTPVYPNLGCTFLQTDGFWSFRDKTSCSEMELCTICMFETVPVFSLKGPLCKSFTPFDYNFYFSVNNSFQINRFFGYKESDITYLNESWQGIMEGVNITLKSNGHPLGRQDWNWFNRRCTNSGTQQRTLSLSICEFGTEFTCKSGRCIPIEKRCDRVSDCKDGSDEDDCVLVQVPDNYNKIQAPENGPENEGEPLPIRTQITLLNVDMIDTVTMLVGLTVEIKMSWNDSRLRFANLNPDKKNPVPERIVEQLWLPLDNILHENAVIGKIHEDDIRRVFVVPISEPILLDGYETYEELLYDGAENSIEVSQRFRIEYDCVFNLEKFPFDEQECDFVMKMNLDHNNSMALVEDDPPIIYNGESKIDQFYIGPFNTNSSGNGKEARFILSIHMVRIYNDQMINTFIPTFLLWLLGYSTLFITIEDFNDRFMGTVTSLLVLASLLSSINMSLPRTSYFKYIDLWFLWYLANIFCIIVYHIMLDFGSSSRKDDAETNDNVTKVLPVKIRIGEKTKVHAIDELADRFDEAFGYKYLKESSSSFVTKKRINNLAIIFFPILILCFNVAYFLLTT